MTDCESRLAGCFRVVFPGLDQESARNASVSSIPEWDSVASVNLMTVIEEEFGIGIDVDDIDRVVSFEALLAYVRARQIQGKQ